MLDSARALKGFDADVLQKVDGDLNVRGFIKVKDETEIYEVADRLGAEVDIAGVLTGRLGVKTTNAAKSLLLTSEGEIVPFLKYGTKSQMDNAIKGAKKISENLYETSIDGRTIRFAASFGNEVPERIGTSTILEEFEGNIVDDLSRTQLRGWQKKSL